MDVFNDCINKCGLVDLRLDGRQLSWCNGQQGMKNIGSFAYFTSLAAKTESWNKKVFGHVGAVVKQLEERLEHLDSKMQVSYFEEVEVEFLTTKAKLEMRRNFSVKSIRLQDGTLLESMERVHEEAVRYFSEFLSQEDSIEMPDLNDIIDPAISAYVVVRLQDVPVENDVYEALASIAVNSSPRPYSFGFAFYLDCWDFIKMDVMEAVESSIGVCLCNVIYKVFFKILVAKLSLEMTKSLHRKVRGGNVMLKLDMSKAYDQVDWWFLEHVLCAMGFPEFFYRGLRQGDPLLPYLFIILEEVFSQLLKKRMSERGISHFFHPVGAPRITHLLYADDVVIFANASKRSIRCLIGVLNDYERWSRQRVNKEKSTIFFSKKLSLGRKREILAENGFVEGHFPFTYLGVPIVDGKLKASHFGPLLEKMGKKVSGLKCRLLSQGDHLILLPHVFSTMPMHLLFALHVPKLVFKKLQGLFANFFWGEQGGKSKWKWRAWQKLYVPMEVGGIGVSDPDEVQKSLFLKFGWNLLTKNFLWAKLFRAKYVKHRHIVLSDDSSSGFLFWKKIMEVMPSWWENTKWRVGEGKVFLWYDNFLGHGPLFRDVREVVEPDLLVETLEHVLGKGNFAKEVWKLASAELGIPFVLQQYWQERVQILTSQIVKVQHLSFMDEHILRRLNVPIVEKSIVQVKVLRWVKPRIGRLKLNLDGSYFGNPSPVGGGGQLQDNGGNLVFGFSKFFDSCSNNEAELRTVIEGIKICWQRGLMCIDIECDSLLVVSWIRSWICTMWSL
ncbi:hypothetical protein F2P56_007063 [Juglans regia]|uniref:Uncharacterized protein LOC108998036 n=2 Tax=Juglans regia TaxID=51240 RepID=A0A2I4FED8_JUGRE|nr:uncharacterized protein LOC108998036 [Juglans regia]KAF5475233.1 hypothetical protein F2P56_007063 [Juglans regia]